MTSGLRPDQLRFDPPQISRERVAAVLAEHWALNGSLRPLHGERDQNTLVRSAGGESFVLKIATPSEEPAIADLQCAALTHVRQADPAIGVPHIVPTVDGRRIVSIDIDGQPARTRLLTYLPGITFDDAGPLGLDALAAVGQFQGRLAWALRSFGHPAATHFMAWSIDSGMLQRNELWDDLSIESRTAIEPHRERVERAASALGSLPRQIVHNDGHRGNLLRADAISLAVTGVIDFGDIAETAVICDLAICAASFIAGHEDQRAALCSIAAGFDRWMRLGPTEVDVLADLVLARMVLGTLLVEFQARHADADAGARITAGLPEHVDATVRWADVERDETAHALHQRLTDKPASGQMPHSSATGMEQP